ncbi:D-glucuronyl C5-epimerase family protein [bacterium]|nr:D-glucuronyl C5-epimerase family protein [bacterium]MDA7660291.1 D-glucuronyl C5-epimerase family protein [Verrucomicrobiota bacterium]
MNFTKKIKLYANYFVTGRKKYHGSINASVKNTYITGYAYEISQKKWEFENDLPLGLFSKDWKVSLEKKVHISGLCEYGMGCLENKQYENAITVFKFIIKHLYHDKKLNCIYWKTYKSESVSDFYNHGMGHGELCMFITWMYRLYPSIENIDILNGLLQVYSVKNVPKLGIVFQNQSKYIIEEYTDLSLRGVLNGWLSGILGLKAIIEYNRDKKNTTNEHYHQLYRKLIVDLEDSINFYDLGFWSLYAPGRKFEYVASNHYHMLHIALLEALSDSKILNQVCLKWKKQNTSVICTIMATFTKLFISNIFYRGHLLKLK